MKLNIEKNSETLLLRLGQIDLTAPAAKDLIEIYSEICDDPKTDISETEHYEILRAAVAYNEGRLTQSIDHYISAIASLNFDPQSHEAFHSGLCKIAVELIRLMQEDPMNLIIGVAYRKLNDLGYLTVDHHVGALYHFILVGDARAFGLAETLLNVCPHYPGLQQMVDRLNQLKMEVK